MNAVGGPLAVRAEGLRKSYGPVTAVSGVDLTVREGETFGFLGPNGAGKSTTISMLCTLIRPGGGYAEVAGWDVERAPEGVRRTIGLVFQESTVDNELTARENLRFHAELYGVPRGLLRPRIDRLLGLMGLSERRDSPLRTFSGGMRRRLEIARSLMHDPRVLFLDEPTVGLDPQTRMLIWDHLHRLRQEQAITLFLTTHYLEEAEHCDRIAIMDRGRIVVQGTPAELKNAVGSDVISLRTADDATALRALHERFAVEAHATPEGIGVRTSDGPALVPRLCAQLPVPVHAVTVRKPSLDDVFVHFTGRTIRDAADTVVGASPNGRE
ncbi:ATP-binding cassette domain-containing protein [Streptomyces harbinensis]|uniref:ATP-binding cassette domain-containing protein n=1 Tax=Streptomyces harbinensis TaxID=1176198 RepID=UPI0036CA9F07